MTCKCLQQLSGRFFGAAGDKDEEMPDAGPPSTSQEETGQPAGAVQSFAPAPSSTGAEMAPGGEVQGAEGPAEGTGAVLEDSERLQQAQQPPPLLEV